MPKGFDDFGNLHARRCKNASFLGLNRFIETLEKYFFSQITIRDISTTNQKMNLVVELNCNLTLEEMVLHFNNGNWGSFSQINYCLRNEINLLEGKNDILINVDEFSIFLKDTSIIINKIYDRSIEDQLEQILITLTNNHFHFTKGFTEVPYEIYVPVFEENIIENNSSVREIQNTQNIRNDYFDFWGLYFESEGDAAVVYDLEEAVVLYEDLHILNE